MGLKRTGSTSKKSATSNKKKPVKKKLVKVKPVHQVKTSLRSNSKSGNGKVLIEEGDSNAMIKAPELDWPQQREILWRPDRFSYLSKKETPGACVFCQARKTGVQPDTLVLYDNGTTMVMLNKFPYNNGHLLVLPSRHMADVADLSEEEYQDFHRLVLQGIGALRKAYEKVPHGINSGMNLGAAAGAGIPGHLHCHIIPRWYGDSNFFPLVGQTKVISETLEQTYQRLLPYFK